MRKSNSKSCNRKKCPYYEHKVCPHREDCEHSKYVVWKRNLNRNGDKGYE